MSASVLSGTFGELWDYATYCATSRSVERVILHSRQREEANGDEKENL
jgi:hypothetical protein